MQSSHRMFLVMLIAAAFSVVFTGMIVLWHAEGVETVAAIQLEIDEVRIRPDDSHNPISMQLTASNAEGLPFYIDSIRLVARANDTVAGTLPRLELDAAVPEGEPLTWEVELDPGSEYEDREALQELRASHPTDWYVDGFMELYPPRSRATERWDFVIEEVGGVD